MVVKQGPKVCINSEGDTGLFVDVPAGWTQIKRVHSIMHGMAVDEIDTLTIVVHPVKVDGTPSYNPAAFPARTKERTARIPGHRFYCHCSLCYPENG